MDLVYVFIKYYLQEWMNQVIASSGEVAMNKNDMEM